MPTSDGFYSGTEETSSYYTLTVHQQTVGIPLLGDNYIERTDTRMAGLPKLMVDPPARFIRPTLPLGIVSKWGTRLT